MRVVVVGGGAAGFSAAMTAKRTGADEVILLERTDMLGGLALVAGIGLCGSGAFIMLEEARAMGGGSLHDEIFFPIATRRELSMPGFDRAMLYNVTRVDARMQRVLAEADVDIRLESRVTCVIKRDSCLEAVTLADGQKLAADCFIDATGSTTGRRGCAVNGYGCVECILRCPSFGDTVGLIDEDVNTVSTKNAWGTEGVLGTSLLIPTASLSEDIQNDIRNQGFHYLTVPPGLKPDMKRAKIAGSHGMAIMSQKKVAENLLLPDVGGYVKSTANASPRYASQFRKLIGMEDSMIAQPLLGKRGHLVYGLGMLPHDQTMRVKGFENLFCAGTKSNHALFIMDVTLSGDLAGLNAVRLGSGLDLLEIPQNLAVGAFLNYANNCKSSTAGLSSIPQGDRQTLAKLGVLRDSLKEIKQAIKQAGLLNIYKLPVS